MEFCGVELDLVSSLKSGVVTFEDLLSRSGNRRSFVRTGPTAAALTMGGRLVLEDQRRWRNQAAALQQEMPPFCGS